MGVPQTGAFVPPARQVRRLSLRETDSPVRQARQFARRALADWQWEPSGEAVEDVVLVVSELVANATAHAGGATEIALVIDADSLSVSVADTDTKPAVASPVEPSRPGGHGLHIVEALATAWGSAPGAHGKTVWALFGG
ncbi:ATP-binding protein [Streptacidiphilus anmyonensis]|uniref:ATP-binding protein n=1 Tax=Streptacidiphilus anmyonensis TaxID=405782 RepID=UPI0007C6B8C3|nr:ATP-binding protein [Streptacidiphilus anmyonensis]